MARARPKLLRRRLGHNDEFALAPHQLLAVQHPAASIRAVLSTHPEAQDPDLARMVNNRLARRID